ncbi:hypothetical protein, partial [Xanthomonas graminis]|uniref:hypothetical protein n=1 Tax=Xanthomonas graminis TaxID=3390026 RepID=UPI001C400229
MDDMVWGAVAGGAATPWFPIRARGRRRERDAAPGCGDRRRCPIPGRTRMTDFALAADWPA